MELTIQIIGWVGTFLIGVSYILVSTGTVKGDSRWYQITNLLGAIGIGVSVVHQKAWPAAALQVFWGLVAIIGLIRSRKNNTPR